MGRRAEGVRLIALRLIEGLAFEVLVICEVIRGERLGNAVLFLEPFAEVDELAAVGAEGAKRVRREIVFTTANGAFDDGTVSHCGNSCHALGL